MSIDELLDAWIPIKYQQPVRRELCPDCGERLDDTERGLHCKWCGWSEGLPPHFIPRVPDIPR
jgi:hypothetical protein